MIQYTDLPAVPLADIHLTGKNYRRRFDPEKHKELTADVKNQGVLNPVTLRRRKDGGFWLVAGERRVRAATDAKLPTVPGRVAENVDDKVAALLGYQENEGRDNLSGYEQAAGLASLVNEHKYTAAELGKLTGKSVGYLNKLLKAMDGLHPTVLKQWEDGNAALTKDVRERLMRMEDKDVQLDNWRCVTEHGVFLDEMDAPVGGDMGGDGAEGVAAEEPPQGPAPWLIGGKGEIKERYAAARKGAKSVDDVDGKWAMDLVDWVLCRRATPPEGVEPPVKPKKEGARNKRKEGEVATS